MNFSFDIPSLVIGIIVGLIVYAVLGFLRNRDEDEDIEDGTDEPNLVGEWKYDEEFRHWTAIESLFEYSDVSISENRVSDQKTAEQVWDDIKSFIPFANTTEAVVKVCKGTMTIKVASGETYEVAFIAPHPDHATGYAMYPEALFIC